MVPHLVEVEVMVSLVFVRIVDVKDMKKISALSLLGGLSGLVLVSVVAGVHNLVAGAPVVDEVVLGVVVAALQGQWTVAIVGM